MLITEAETTAPGHTSTPWWKILLALVAVATLGLAIPGGGLALALVFYFTAFRHQPIARWLALGLGVVLLVGALFGLGSTTSQDFHSTTTVVQQ